MRRGDNINRHRLSYTSDTNDSSTLRTHIEHYKNVVNDIMLTNFKIQEFAIIQGRLDNNQPVRYGEATLYMNRINDGYMSTIFAHKDFLNTNDVMQALRDELNLNRRKEAFYMKKLEVMEKCLTEMEKVEEDHRDLFSPNDGTQDPVSSVAEGEAGPSTSHGPLGSTGEAGPSLPQRAQTPTEYIAALESTEPGDFIGGGDD
jgi:hypothetical protein